VQFGADLGLSLNLYTQKEFDWRSLDTIHLMINHRSYRASYILLYYLFSCVLLRNRCILFIVDPYYNQTPSFDEKIVKTYPYPFGDMAREMILASGMETFIDQKI